MRSLPAYLLLVQDSLKGVFLLLCLMAGSVHLHAQEMEVPVPVQMELLTKILSFDRSLDTKANGREIVVNVLYQEKFRASVLAKNEWLQQAEKIQPLIGNYTLRLRAVALPETFDPARLPGRSEGAVYCLMPLRNVDLKLVSQKARSEKIMVFSAVATYVSKGACVGIGLRGERPEIVVHHSESLAQGCQFSSQLLKVARVIK